MKNKPIKNIYSLPKDSPNTEYQSEEVLEGIWTPDIFGLGDPMDPCMTTATSVQLRKKWDQVSKSVVKKYVTFSFVQFI